MEKKVAKFEVTRVEYVNVLSVCKVFNTFTNVDERNAFEAFHALKKNPKQLSVSDSSFGGRQVITASNASKPAIYLDGDEYRNFGHFEFYAPEDVREVFFSSFTSQSYLRASQVGACWIVECGCPIWEDGTVYKGGYWRAFSREILGEEVKSW
jgi:hypothetical protein